MQEWTGKRGQGSVCIDLLPLLKKPSYREGSAQTCKRLRSTNCFVSSRSKDSISNCESKVRFHKKGHSRWLLKCGHNSDIQRVLSAKQIPKNLAIINGMDNEDDKQNKTKQPKNIRLKCYGVVF